MQQIKQWVVKEMQNNTVDKMPLDKTQQIIKQIYM